MRTAHLFAERATCKRGKVGAVLVKDDRIISTGYNGAPPGMPHCTDVGCDELILFEKIPGILMPQFEPVELGCQRTIHAEANVLLYAARHGIPTEGAHLYCTYSPCERCALLLANAGIKKLIYDKPYRATPWQLIKELGIKVKGREGG
jgi:dCMP deaminase